MSTRLELQIELNRLRAELRQGHNLDKFRRFVSTWDKFDELDNCGHGRRITDTCSGCDAAGETWQAIRNICAELDSGVMGQETTVALAHELRGLLHTVMPREATIRESKFYPGPVTDAQRAAWRAQANLYAQGLNPHPRVTYVDKTGVEVDVDTSRYAPGARRDPVNGQVYPGSES